MATLYLIRHTSYTEKYRLLPGRLPVELSEKGIKEAEKLNRYFRRKSIEKIYSSAVLRCKQTSEIISDGKIPIEYDQRLLEGLSAYQGYWDPESWDQFWGHRHQLGGESDSDIQKRVLDFFDTTNFEAEKNYIICSHGDPLYYIYQKISGVPPLAEIELGDEVINPEDYQKKGSVRIIIRKNGNWTVADTINQDEL
jgi:broad specificity phosphatase PhoE